MRSLAIILALGYLIAIAWYMPGRDSSRAQHQISVEQLAEIPAVHR